MRDFVFEIYTWGVMENKGGVSIYHRVKNINSENFITGFMGGISVEKETVFFFSEWEFNETYFLSHRQRG